MAKVALQAPSNQLLHALQVDSAVLQIVADEFSKMVRSDEIKVYSFREERGMSGLYGLNSKVSATVGLCRLPSQFLVSPLMTWSYQFVNDFSSVIGDAAEAQEGIDANHTQMCKFSSSDDPGYQKVLGVLKKFVRDASSANDDNNFDLLKKGQ